MEDREYHNGLAFGMSGLDRLLELARPAMQDADSCERLYDFARSAVLALVRCDRGQDELERWKEGLYKISALALGSYTDGGSKYLLETASRFEALGHLLADQTAWKEAYSLPGVLDLPFVASTVSFLEDKGAVKMEDYLTAMGMRHTSIVSILAQLDFVTWDETVKGEILIWLTPKGRLLAVDLHTQERLKTEA